MMVPLPILTPGRIMDLTPIQTSSPISTGSMTLPCSNIGLDKSEKLCVVVRIITSGPIITFLPIVTEPLIQQFTPKPLLSPIFRWLPEPKLAPFSMLTPLPHSENNDLHRLYRIHFANLPPNE
jgi:hypothetical protein